MMFRSNDVPNNFDVKNIDLYNIIMMFRSNDVTSLLLNIIIIL